MISINKFNLSYNSGELFQNFDFNVKKSQIVGIYGPTGCGKTSLLNKIVNDYIKTYKISYIFQDNKLLENKSVYENVVIPLKNLFSKDKSEKLAKEYLEIFNINHKLKEKVSVLSGGEKQRVNIARAFAYPCEIMLLDEPFSAQDDIQRDYLVECCNKILRKRKITAVVVSHNISELEKLCDKIVKIPSSN